MTKDLKKSQMRAYIQKKGMKSRKQLQVYIFFGIFRPSGQQAEMLLLIDLKPSSSGIGHPASI